jgi:hypothetical protein
MNNKRKRNMMLDTAEYAVSKFVKLYNSITLYKIKKEARDKAKASAKALDNFRKEANKKYGKECRKESKAQAYIAVAKEMWQNLHAGVAPDQPAKDRSYFSTLMGCMDTSYYMGRDYEKRKLIKPVHFNVTETEIIVDGISYTKVKQVSHKLANKVFETSRKHIYVEYFKDCTNFVQSGLVPHLESYAAKHDFQVISYTLEINETASGKTFLKHNAPNSKWCLNPCVGIYMVTHEITQAFINRVQSLLKYNQKVLVVVPGNGGHKSYVYEPLGVHRISPIHDWYYGGAYQSPLEAEQAATFNRKAYLLLKSKRKQHEAFVHQRAMTATKELYQSMLDDNSKENEAKFTQYEWAYWLHAQGNQCFYNPKDYFKYRNYIEILGGNIQLEEIIPTIENWLPLRDNYKPAARKERTLESLEKGMHTKHANQKIKEIRSSAAEIKAEIAFIKALEADNILDELVREASYSFCCSCNSPLADRTMLCPVCQVLNKHYVPQYTELSLFTLMSYDDKVKAELHPDSVEYSMYFNKSASINPEDFIVSIKDDEFTFSKFKVIDRKKLQQNRKLQQKENHVVVSEPVKPPKTIKKSRLDFLREYGLDELEDIVQFPQKYTRDDGYYENGYLVEFKIYYGYEPVALFAYGELYKHDDHKYVHSVKFYEYEKIQRHINEFPDGEDYDELLEDITRYPHKYTRGGGHYEFGNLTDFDIYYNDEYVAYYTLGLLYRAGETVYTSTGVEFDEVERLSKHHSAAQDTVMKASEEI